MKVIGITGGVGSGKSRVLSYLSEEYGAYVCQADHVAWELQLPGEVCYKQIVEVFGKEVLGKAEEIDRQKLGTIVFSDADKLKELNRIMHPAVKERILALVEEQKALGTALFVLEAALLLEENYDVICDEMWYIFANERVRRIRLHDNRNYTEERIDAIMASQISEEVFRDRCDVVIDNSGAFEETCRQIKETMK